MVEYGTRFFSASSLAGFGPQREIAAVRRRGCTETIRHLRPSSRQIVSKLSVSWQGAGAARFEAKDLKGGALQ